MHRPFSLSSLTVLLAAAPLCAALPQQPAQDFAVFNAFHAGRTVPQRIDDDARMLLPGNIHPAARQAALLGPVDPHLKMDRMILTLKMSADAQLRRDQLLAAQQDPKSPYFHKWLTAAQYGQLFGPSQEDVDAVATWLMGQGFSIDEIAPSRTTINFSGDAAKVQRAFRTTLENISVGGEIRHANISEPSIPSALGDVVGGVVSLHNIPIPAMNRGFRKLTDEEAQQVRKHGAGTSPDYTNGSTHYLTPGDYATIYNLTPLYTASIDGTGQTVAIVGRTDITHSGTASAPDAAGRVTYPSTDVDTFRTLFSQSANTPHFLYNGTNPGVVSQGEEGEADLDLEWSGAVAKGANITFVVSPSTSSDGVALSAQYIVNNNTALGASVMSTSFGLCEASEGSGGNSFWNSIWSQAATEGITAMVSSGDAGAAGCDAASATGGTGLGINGLGSTPYNVCVGGTMFDDTASPSTYWNSSNNADLSSAKSYIPEKVWNESSAEGGAGNWSSGGGVSTVYTKPSWQAGTGVPADGMRDCPDVALTAAAHDGYFTVIAGGDFVSSGTSAASPSFAGIMALVAQHNGGAQGNANYSLYELARAQEAGGTAIFHDVTTGDNSVSGVTGYSAGTGYDMATGLGSVDANALVTHWITPDTLPPSVTASVSGERGVVALTATVADNVGVVRVDFTLDGVAYGTKTSAPFKMGWNSTLGADSGHFLKLTAYDAANNSTTTGPIVFTIDNTPPTGTCSASGGRGAIFLNSNAADATSGVAKAALYLDGKLYGTTTTAPYRMGWNSVNGADGSHSLYAVITDVAGNTATTATANFSIDNTPPSGACAESGSGGIVSFTANATDNVGVTKVVFSLDGKVYGTDTTAPFKMGWNSALGTNGSHTLTAQAYDAAGNVANLTQAVFTISN